MSAGPFSFMNTTVPGPGGLNFTLLSQQLDCLRVRLVFRSGVCLRTRSARSFSANG